MQVQAKTDFLLLLVKSGTTGVWMKISSEAKDLL